MLFPDFPITVGLNLEDPWTAFGGSELPLFFFETSGTFPMIDSCLGLLSRCVVWAVSIPISVALKEKED